MEMVRSVLGIFLLIILLAVPARAGDWYLSAYTGAVFPKGDNIEATDKPIVDIASGSHINYGGGQIYGIKGGYLFANGLGLQADLSKYAAAQNTSGTMLLPQNAHINYASNMAVTAGTFNVLYRFKDEGLRPYAGVGAGLFRFGIDAGVASLNNGAAYAMIPALSTYRFGEQAFAGLDYGFSRKISAYIEYRHTAINVLGMNGGFNTDQGYVGIAYHFGLGS